MDDKMEPYYHPEYFGLWINLSLETINELFEGETVWIAKNRGQKMSTMLYMQIYQHRNQ